MIFSNKADLNFKHPDDVFELDEDSRELIQNLDRMSWVFVVPKSITDDHERYIYKAGFLVTLIKNLQPKTSYSNIYTKVIHEWHVFKSKRQIERLLKKYRESYYKKEEN